MRFSSFSFFFFALFDFVVLYSSVHADRPFRAGLPQGAAQAYRRALRRLTAGCCAGLPQGAAQACRRAQKSNKGNHALFIIFFLPLPYSTSWFLVDRGGHVEHPEGTVLNQKVIK